MSYILAFYWIVAGFAIFNKKMEGYHKAVSLMAGRGGAGGTATIHGTGGVAIGGQGGASYGPTPKYKQPSLLMSLLFGGFMVPAYLLAKVMK